MQTSLQGQQEIQNDAWKKELNNRAGLMYRDLNWSDKKVKTQN